MGDHGRVTERPLSAHAEDHNACLCKWRPASMVVASWPMLVSPTLNVVHHANRKFSGHGDGGGLISA